LAVLAAVLLLSGVALGAADYEDIVLANQVAARLRHPGPFGSITQRAAKVNQNINDAFEREDVGHPQMALRLEDGAWTLYIGKTRLLSVYAQDAAPSGKTTRELAGIWLSNFKRLFPLAEPVIHMDDPFGQGGTPRGPGHRSPADPAGPPPPRHDEGLPADVRLVLASFDEARRLPNPTSEVVQQQAAALLERLGSEGPEDKLGRAREALEAALYNVRQLSTYQFEVKRVTWAELALKRVAERLGLRVDVAQAPGGPVAVAGEAEQYDLCYRPEVGQKTTARLSLSGPAKLLDAAGNQLVAMDGALTVDVTTEVVEVGENSFLLSLRFSNARLIINGADTPVEQHEGEVVLEMDRHGRVLETELKTGEGTAPLAALGTEIAPRLLSLARFKGEPVRVGDAWSYNDEVADGERTLKATCESKLLQVADGVATVTETGALDLPQTELSFGGIKIPVQEGSVSLGDLQRQVDLQTGATRGAQGKVALELKGEREGLKLTIKAEFDMVMEPAEA
jgi:hypothetical protein